MLENIKAGEWALLVIVEDRPPGGWFDRGCKELRYIFLKREVDSENVLQYGLKDFYEHTTGQVPTLPWPLPHRGTYPIE
jgi:hypothetical protein